MTAAILLPVIGLMALVTAGVWPAWVHLENRRRMKRCDELEQSQTRAMMVIMEQGDRAAMAAPSFELSRALTVLRNDMVDFLSYDQRQELDALPRARRQPIAGPALLGALGAALQTAPLFLS